MKNNKVTHQVQRHKDGMQELRCVGLRDERLQTGLKKPSNETHLRHAGRMKPQTSGSTHQKAKRVFDFLKNVQKFLFWWRTSFHGQKVICTSKRGVTNCCSHYSILLFCRSSRHFQLFAPFNRPHLTNNFAFPTFSSKIISSDVECLFQHVPANKTSVTNILLLCCYE